MIETASLQRVRRAATGLLARWMGLLAPHYGPSGSMDLDLRLYPDAEGPSHMNQFAHYPLLLLSEGIVSNPVAPLRRTMYRRLALRNLRYALRITGRDFKQPLWSRGRSWGRVHSDWMIFFLQRSWRIVEERRLGSPAFRDGLARVVEGSVDAAFRDFRARFEPRIAEGARSFPGNHAAWWAALFHEAGRVWRREEWRLFGERFFHSWVLPFQDADGFWPEGGGMVGVYGMVTAQALSVYAGASGDAAARRALGKFLAGYRRFVFPDMSVSCVADCRMTYHDRPVLLLAPEFLAFEGGAAFCLDSVRAGERWLRREPPRDNGAQGAAFFGVFVEALRGAASGRALPLPRPRLAKVARVESPHWCALLSARLNSETASRWCLDNQNFVDLWGPRCGLLAGGGNSKHAPLLSSVREVGGSRAFLPSRARIVRRGARAVEAEYRFRGAAVRVRLHVRGREASLTWRVAQGRLPLEAAVILALREGDCLRTADGRVLRARAAECIELALEPRTGPLLARGVAILAPAGARLLWPIALWNPYRQDSLGGPLRARLAWRLSRRPSVVRFLAPSRPARLSGRSR